MMQKFFKLFLIVSFSALTFSCGTDREFDQKRHDGYKSFPKRKDTWFNNGDKLDPYADLDREDYQSLINTEQNFPKSAGPVAPKITMPDVTDLIAEPDDQKLISDKLVSISVNENVPLKDVIVELARRADVDVEIDKDIEGSIIFIAKDKPFSEVIKRISDMANLTYSFDDGILKIKKDAPVVKNYKFNLLDITRNSQSTINTSFTVGGTNGGTGGGSNNSSTSNSTGGSSATGGSFGGGSNSSLSAKSGDGDIWANIKSGIEQIISKYTDSPSSSSTSTDAATGATTPQNTGTSGIMALNKNAGLISILATEKQHKAIKEFLDRIHIELTSQVLIEARVVEVNLSDEYRSGINWSVLTNGNHTTNNLNIGGTFGATAASASAVTDGFKFSLLPTDLFGANASLANSIELLQTFGTTRSLSNPRISTLNNQFAVLNFSKNEVYFEVEENSTTTTSTASTTESNLKTTIRSVPIGVVLTLLPSIDLEKNEILMNVRPTLTRVTDRVDDPGAQIIAKKNDLDLSTFKSQIPVVDTRELDTMLRIKNGEIMVIGGLLEERSENTDKGLPGLGSIPYLGNAFKGVTKTATNVETVIFLKATIVPGRGVSVEDKDFYKKFTTSRSKFFPEQ